MQSWQYAINSDSLSKSGLLLGGRSEYNARVWI